MGGLGLGLGWSSPREVLQTQSATQTKTQKPTTRTGWLGFCGAQRSCRCECFIHTHSRWLSVEKDCVSANAFAGQLAQATPLAAFLDTHQSI
jgi:hypothetical protein